MILIVATGYPNEKDKYNNNFIHTRVKAYIREGIDSEVFIIGSSNPSYVYDGVQLSCGDWKALSEKVNNDANITCVCFHFLDIPMLKAIQKFRRDVVVTIFVHGNEALWWYERIFPDKFADTVRILKFIKYAIKNTVSINYIKRRINTLGENVNIVCVSEWMKDIAVKNWKIDETKIKTHIIPNIIDETIFPYKSKEPDDRFNILMIRSFTNGKYALDIAMDIIRELQNYPEKDRIHISVYGDGWLWDKYTERIKGFSNVELNKRMLPHGEIATVHSHNGIFLCPTRQDAQGVSMCEAMSSGLIPISSNNTAIPEFLPSEFNLMFNSPKEAAQRIIEIIRNSEEFEYLSKAVSDYIQKKCCAEMTTNKELKLMKYLSQN